MLNYLKMRRREIMILNLSSNLNFLSIEITYISIIKEEIKDNANGCELIEVHQHTF